MKPVVHALVLILGLGFGLAAPAAAQEEPPKKDEPPKQEPAKEETPTPAPEATPAPAAEPAKDEAAKPAPEATSAPAAAAAPAAAPAKEMSSCAKSFSPLAERYKSAYDDMQKWIGQIDTQTAAAGDKVQKLQTQVQQNETAITQAKLDKNDSKAKELQKENKKLWDDLNAAKKEMSTLCSGFVKQASDRAKQYADASDKALDALKSQTK